MQSGIPVEKRVVDYAIVNEVNAVACADKVRAYLADGWVLHGDMKVWHNEALQLDHFIQAVAKVEIRPVPGFDSAIARPSGNILLG